MVSIVACGHLVWLCYHTILHEIWVHIYYQNLCYFDSKEKVKLDISTPLKITAHIRAHHELSIDNDQS